ncbi:MAG: SCO family protein [Phycisphaerales bacterium JB039]
MTTLRRHLGLLSAALVSVATAPAAPGQVVARELPEQVRGLDVIEKLGEQVPLDAKITDSEGRTVELGTYFEPTADGRDIPVILALVYYDCPVACPATLNAISQCVRGLDYTVGEDFRVVVVSFDPTNTTEQAREEEHYALLAYGRGKTSAVREGYRFHTAAADEVRRIADAVGFQYRYLPEVDQYGHPSAVFVLSPDGVVSRYMYGYQFFPGQMRLALLEASQGRIARSFGDKIRLFCYSYDPESGAYTLQAWMVMRIVGVITVIGLGAMVAVLKIHEVRRRAKAPARRQRTRVKQDAAPAGSPALGGGVRSV